MNPEAAAVPGLGMAPAPALAPAPAPALAPADLPPALRRVVVIDDSEIDAELLRMRLQEHYPGLEEMRWIRHAEGVVEEIAAFAPDIVISDFHMPGYDLIATLVALRRRWPALPLLVMSGLVGEEKAVQVLRAGANDFLPKSRSERLPMVIDRELAEARARSTEARLQDALARQLRVNQAIFDQAPVGLWILSPAGAIERANRHAEQMMGPVDRSDTDGLAHLQGWWGDSGAPIGRLDWPGARAIREHAHVPLRMMRLRTRDGDGDERHFNCGAAPLLAEDGSSLGAIVTAMDLSDEVRLQERLRRAEKRLRRLSLNQVVRHERQMANVSRELHDNLGQVLSLLKLHLGSAARADMPQARRELELEEALPLVDLALSRLREVCNDLRPSELSDFGLGPAIGSLCSAASRASGIEVAAHVAGEPRALEPVLKLGLFRVAQQALTNALRHADAETVRVELQWRTGSVELCVSDDGRGFDLDAPRQSVQQGLRGMHERMELLDGLLRVDSRPGAGTTVWASVPTEPVPKVAP